MSRMMFDLLCLVVTAAARLVYRLRVEGLENVPEKGGAMVVANHLSLVDWLLVMSGMRRPVRFVIERRFYDAPLLRGLLARAGAIPVSRDGSRIGHRAFLREVGDALGRGEVVCIFAEGTISRTGLLQGFRRGVERLSQAARVPVVPLWIGGVWGSSFSYARGDTGSRRPVFPPPRVTLLFGEPLPAGTDPFVIRAKVAELSCRWFDMRRGEKGRRLGPMMLRNARRNWRSTAVSDSSGRSLTYAELACAAAVLAHRLRKLCPQEMTGVMLPPSVPGAVVNAALVLAGKVPVNLNPLLPPASFRAAWERCGIVCLIGSKELSRRFPDLPLPPRVLSVEELLAGTTLSERLRGWLRGRVLPVGTASPRGDAGAPAAVLYSSGSTSEPKGVVQTHHGIISNIEGIRWVLKLSPSDSICSGLPFFHSLGLTATVWLPLISPVAAAYHPNPLEGEAMGRLVRRRRGTILLATPTFLSAYRRVPEQDFATLRLVVTGGEKLRRETAEQFRDRFGVLPLEGYGMTELSPVVAFNVPDASCGGITHAGSKPDSVGIPLPGVAVRVRDTGTGDLLGAGARGMVEIKGPNVMGGYLGSPAETAAVMNGGWYVSGDLGWVDDDGFLFITDRVSRFSKIGGEMVPHGAVEDELSRLLGGEGQGVAVTAVPDGRKGERLVALLAEGRGTPAQARELVAGSTLPNLWKPSLYFQVESLPLLATGKVDMRKVRSLAGELAAREAASGGG